MLEVIKTRTFDDWLRGLRDTRARARINARLRRLSLGHPGDVKPVGGGVYEMRIFHGPGYRLYFLRDGKSSILLLCGGDKDGQRQDIKRAKALAERWRSVRDG